MKTMHAKNMAVIKLAKKLANKGVKTPVLVALTVARLVKQCLDYKLNHKTSEFYNARAKLTWFAAQHGFLVVKTVPCAVWKVLYL